MNEIIDKIFDKNLISDLRFSLKDNKIVAWSKRSKYKIVLPQEINKKIAYLSGAIMGDGNISISKRKIIHYPRLRLIIFNASKDYLEFLNNEFYNIFKVNGTISKKKDKNCYMLTINKKILVLYFLKIMGIFAGKKERLKIPEKVKDKNLFRFFVGGLYDTDGFFSDTFGIMMNGSNYNFLKEISIFLEDYYKISSRKIYYGYLNTNRGLKTRSQLQIKTDGIRKFINIIPLKHIKYGLVV